MKRNTTIKIDGAKLRNIIETRLGVNLYQFSINNGFSKNYMQKICKANRATPSTQAVLKLNGIEPEEYIYKEEIKDPERAQLSIDDIEEAKREELKALIKESIVEILKEYAFAIVDDPVRCEHNIYFHKRVGG